MAKNLKISTDEYKLSGTLNTDNSEEGIVLLEIATGEVNLIEYLQSFNGADVEFALKKKVETEIV
jgi:hypothetical protein